MAISFPSRIRESFVSTEVALHQEAKHIKEIAHSRLEKLRAKKRELGAFLRYVKETYYNKPFMAVYIPTRATYGSIWMLVPGGLYNFQQLGFDPIGIQAVTAIASSINAALAPINGLLNDKFKNPQYITAVEQAAQFAAAAGRTIAPTPDMYIRVNALESFSNGQLDWGNKLGATLNRGKYRSTAKMLFRLINTIINIGAGFAGAYIYQYFGPLPLIAATIPLVLSGLIGYLVGSRKYADYWNKQMGRDNNVE